MKNNLANSIVSALITIFLLNACTGTSSKQPDPPETAIPASSATPTLILTPAPILVGNYELLSPEDMRHDLDELFHQIETVHPNPYTKHPKVEVDRDRQRIYEELDQPMTMIDFYKKVDPLIASLGDYHTSIFLPDNTYELISESELFLPLEVEFDGRQWFITANYSSMPDIPVGAELLSINGMRLSTIQSDLNLNMDFIPISLWLLYGSIPEYQVEILPACETIPITIDMPGMTIASMAQDSGSSPPSEPVVYTKIPNEPVGVLAINTFIGIGPLLKPAFTHMQEEDVQHLIIDVRTNPGGSDIAPLMDYLTDQPYRLCSRSYKAPFSGYGSGDPRETECGVIQPFNTAERFQGKLYLLIGPDSFSAPIVFGNILQDYGLATLLGEETTDSASFCASAVQSVLPRTKLSYRISTECYVRPSGVLDDRPLIPDIFVETTIADQIADRDPVLEHTLEIIRNSE